MAAASGDSLKILHLLRAPVGGLFRHVLDLARAQAERGHRVGLVADSTRGGARAEQDVAELAPLMAFGVSRVPISRTIGPRDVSALLHVARRVRDVSPDVIHGHGAKGAAYGRLVPRHGAIRAYTPHGGSLFFDWNTPEGVVYLSLERMLRPRTELFMFESAYIQDIFRRKVGEPGARARVVHNGIKASDFVPVVPEPGATDLVFVGELRSPKGIEVLIEAIKRLTDSGHRISATIVGDGRDGDALQAQVKAQGLGGAVRFVGAKPARAGFALGRVVVIPSRAESLPYIVLEAIAAGMPMVVTDVGGIPEIFGPDAGSLIPAGDVDALVRAIRETLRDVGTPEAKLIPLRERLQARLRTGFTVDAMTDAVIAAYRQAMAQRDGSNSAQAQAPGR